jgi:hypothetical protein
VQCEIFAAPEWLRFQGRVKLFEYYGKIAVLSNEIAAIFLSIYFYISAVFKNSFPALRPVYEFKPGVFLLFKHLTDNPCFSPGCRSPPSSVYLRLFQKNGGTKMNIWQKYTNYKKLENPDGSYTYKITVDGENIEVSEAVYNDYAAIGRKIRYAEVDLKYTRALKDLNGKSVRDKEGFLVMLPEREISLENFNQCGITAKRAFD